MKQCFFVFRALTNDKNMREILRGKKEDFQHFQKVVEDCAIMAQSKELKALKSQISSDKLESYASAFLKCYVRQHCSVYADLIFEIKETEVPVKKEPKEGEKEEEETDEIKDKRKRNAES